MVVCRTGLERLTCQLVGVVTLRSCVGEKGGGQEGVEAVLDYAFDATHSAGGQEGPRVSVSECVCVGEDRHRQVDMQSLSRALAKCLSVLWLH